MLSVDDIERQLRDRIDEYCVEGRLGTWRLNVTRLAEVVNEITSLPACGAMGSDGHACTLEPHPDVVWHWAKLGPGLICRWRS